MTRADWGCLDDDHRSWIIVEVDDEATANLMVPPVLRPNAKVIRLFEFEPEHLDLLHQLPPEQFVEMRRLSYKQLNEVFTAPPDEAMDVVHRLLENLPPSTK